MFYYHTLKELEDLVNENKLEVWQVIEQSDMEENGRTKEQSYEKMLNMYLAMKEADKNYNGNLKSASKRAGGDGEKIHRYNAANKNICGKFIEMLWKRQLRWASQMPVCEELLRHLRPVPVEFCLRYLLVIRKNII